MSMQVDKKPGANRPQPAGQNKARAATAGSTAARTKTPASNGKVNVAGAPATRPANRGRRKQQKQNWNVVLIGVAGIVVVVGLLWLLSSGFGSPAASTTGTTGTTTSPGSAPSGTLAAGTLAPDFTLPDANGNNVTLSSYRGKVVILEFFAPWCPHCQEDAPEFNNIAATYGSDVQVLAVSASPYGKDHVSPITNADITWFRDTYNVQFPILFDKDVAQGTAYGISYYPMVYVLDGAGKVVAIPDNPITVDSIKPIIEQAKAAAAVLPEVAQVGGSQQ